jgi:hypothetical protein
MRSRNDVTLDHWRWARPGYLGRRATLEHLEVGIPLKQTEVIKQPCHNVKAKTELKGGRIIMYRWKTLTTAVLLICSITACFPLYAHYHLGQKMTKTHTLQFPMLLGGPEGNGPYQLLPKGTILYYDQSYPEGFTRYRIYVSIDRYPLDLTELSDPYSIDPLSAFAMDKGDLKRLLDRNPITKDDLTAILKSDQLSKQEIRELLEEYSK